MLPRYSTSSLLLMEKSLLESIDGTLSLIAPPSKLLKTKMLFILNLKRNSFLSFKLLDEERDFKSNNQKGKQINMRAERLV